MVCRVPQLSSRATCTGSYGYEEAVRAVPHLLLSHGKAVELLKGEFKSVTPIGITLNLAPKYAKTDSVNDQLAMNNADGYANRWFLDPVFKGQYPVDIDEPVLEIRPFVRFIEEGDMETIFRPV